MKKVKMLILGAVLSITGCMSMPHDPAMELDTINKKIVVLAEEVRAVIKTANQLYSAGLLPDGSSEYMAVDRTIEKIYMAYQDIKSITNLAEYTKKEKSIHAMLFDLRKLLAAVMKKEGDVSYERTEGVGFRDCRANSQREYGSWVPTGFAIS